MSKAKPKTRQKQKYNPAKRDKRYAMCFPHEIVDPIYGTTLHFAHGDHQAMESYVQKFFPDFRMADDSKQAPAMVIIKENGLFMFIAREFVRDPGVIAHECLHYVFAVMRRAGIFYSRDSEEAYTYLLTFAVDQVHKCIREDYSK